MTVHAALPGLVGRLEEANDRALEMIFGREMALDLGLVSGSGMRMLPRGHISRRSGRGSALDELHVMRMMTGGGEGGGGGGSLMVKKEDQGDMEEDDEDNVIGVVDGLMIEEGWEGQGGLLLGGPEGEFGYQWRSLFVPSSSSSLSGGGGRSVKQEPDEEDEEEDWMHQQQQQYEYDEYDEGRGQSYWQPSSSSSSSSLYQQQEEEEEEDPYGKREGRPGMRMGEMR